MTHRLSTKLAALLVAMGLALPVLAEKPEKLPVAFGAWQGPRAATFKSALRRGLAKECNVVAPKAARALIDGQVSSEDGKKFSVKVIVKSPKTKEIIEQREYTYSKPSVSQAQANRMGREVAAMARRVPE
jgi:hypothetical protein